METRNQEKRVYSVDTHDIYENSKSYAKEILIERIKEIENWDHDKYMKVLSESDDISVDEFTEKVDTRLKQIEIDSIYSVILNEIIDSEDYFTEQEAKDLFNEFLKRNEKQCGNLFLLSCNLGTWQGHIPGFELLYIYDFKSLMSLIYKDEMNFRWEYHVDDNIFRVYKYHHDGTNVYDFIPIHDLSFGDLREHYKSYSGVYPEDNLQEDEKDEELTKEKVIEMLSGYAKIAR